MKKELRFVKSGMKMYYKNTLYAGKGEIFNDNWIDEPIYCKKTNSEMTQDKKTSLFILKNDQLEDSKIDLQLISSVAMMENYLMDVNYMFDYEKLSEYCMKYWMGK